MISDVIVASKRFQRDLTISIFLRRLKLGMLLQVTSQVIIAPINDNELVGQNLARNNVTASTCRYLKHLFAGFELTSILND
jgi:hypothetical protein